MIQTRLFGKVGNLSKYVQYFKHTNHVGKLLGPIHHSRTLVETKTEALNWTRRETTGWTWTTTEQTDGSATGAMETAESEHRRISTEHSVHGS